MALLSRKEFADEIGQSAQWVGVYIRRGKIIEKETNQKKGGKKVGVIDTTDMVNAAMLEKYRMNKELYAPPPEPEAPKKVKPVPFEIKDKAPAEKEEVVLTEKTQSKALTERANIELKIKKQALIKAKAETQKISLNNAKLQGELIPVKLCVNYQAAVVRALFQSIEKECENWVGEIVSILGGTPTDRADGINRLKMSLNKAGESAQEEMIKSIELIIDEYSNTRGKGERL